MVYEVFFILLIIGIVGGIAFEVIILHVSKNTFLQLGWGAFFSFFCFGGALLLYFNGVQTLEVEATVMDKNVYHENHKNFIHETRSSSYYLELDSKDCEGEVKVSKSFYDEVKVGDIVNAEVTMSLFDTEYTSVTGLALNDTESSEEN